MASELAAMFCHSVIPTLRSHYLRQATTDREQTEGEIKEYEKKCKDLAVKLQMKPHEWPLVTLPFFVSMDWDSRHTWVRSVLAVPRVRAPRMQTATDEALEAALPGYSQEAESQANARAAADTRRDASNRGGFSAAMVRQAAVAPTRQQQLDAYIEQHGVDPRLYYLWRMALVQPELWATMIPLQFMPLSKVSPDIHCVVEHMVGTVKNAVRMHLMQDDLQNKALWLGQTYQHSLVQAVNARGRGQKGVKHISGSVRKQPLVCEILAADEGEELELRYVFGEASTGQRNSKGRKELHKVKGTAGEWIRLNKWT